MGEVFPEQVSSQDKSSQEPAAGRAGAARPAAARCLCPGTGVRERQLPGWINILAGWMQPTGQTFLAEMDSHLPSALCTSVLQQVKGLLHDLGACLRRLNSSVSPRYLRGRNSNTQDPFTSSHVSGYKWLLNFKTNSLFQILSFLSIYNVKYLSLPLPQPTCWYVKWGTCWQIGCKCYFSFPYYIQSIQITPSWTHINSQLCLFQSCKADLTVQIDTRK